MRRREFIALLTRTAIARPPGAGGQQPMPVIGILSTGSPKETPTAKVLAALRQGLEDAGYVEGQNVAIEYRFAEGRYDRLPALAAELVRRPVAVIVTSGTPAAPAARAATATIPIVFIFARDPVAARLVALLNPPGCKPPGASVIIAALAAKN